MIFCETRNIGWEAVRNVWMQSLQDVVKPYVPLLIDLFDWVYPPITYFVTKYCSSSTNTTVQELIFSMTKILKSLFDFDEGLNSNCLNTNAAPGTNVEMLKVVEGCFFYSIIWSVGGCIDGPSRRLFNDFFRMLLSGSNVSDTDEFKDFLLKSPDYVYDNGSRMIRSNVPVPEAGSVYDYYFDSKTVRWISWWDTAHGSMYSNGVKIEKDAKFNSIVVPTIDTIRNEWLFEKLLLKGYHVMCTGDTGTGWSHISHPYDHF